VAENTGDNGLHPKVVELARGKTRDEGVRCIRRCTNARQCWAAVAKIRCVTI
jgi:hypothetical protein